MEFERTMSTEERIKQLDEEKKELKKRLILDRQERKDALAKMKASRDEDIKNVSNILLSIRKEIFVFNKAGKKRKVEMNILGKIKSIISNNAHTEPVVEEL